MRVAARSAWLRWVELASAAAALGVYFLPWHRVHVVQLNLGNLFCMECAAPSAPVREVSVFVCTGFHHNHESLVAPILLGVLVLASPAALWRDHPAFVGARVLLALAAVWYAFYANLLEHLFQPTDTLPAEPGFFSCLLCVLLVGCGRLGSAAWRRLRARWT